MQTTTATETIAKMTAKGIETMTAIGKQELSYFDDGVAEYSGIWGECLVSEMGHKSSGVINRLRDLGLFTATPQEHDEYDAGAWWALTALGAEVANLLAADAPVVDEVAEEIVATATGVEVKRGPKWSYIFVNGEQVMEVRSHLVDQVLATVNFG